MLLGRLRIRGKLALLVLIPLLATVALAVSSAIEQGTKGIRAQETVDAVGTARLTGELVRELQLERLLSVGLLRGNADQARLAVQNANVTDKAANLQRMGGDLPPAVAAALGQLTNLTQLRVAAANGTASPTALFAGYGATITALIDSTHLLDAVDGDTAQGRQVIGLDAIMRANEGFATLLAAMAVVSTPADLLPFTPGVSVIVPAATRFLTYATPEQQALYNSAIAAIDTRLGKDFAVGLLTNPGDVIQLKSLPSFGALESLTGVGRFVETKIINDVLGTANASATAAATTAYVYGFASIFAILLAILLGYAIARSVSVPLRRLTQSADRVARLAESELVRVSDDDSLSPEPARLRPIDVAGRDELGDLARAFERVQETAARLVERQVAGRRNVAQMFGHVGRRTQNLVGRQVALIDKLENDETEPARLRDLYRLDHVSSRLRRSASSLVVLSGASGADEHMAPVGLGDVVRLALAEIEDYSRVDVDVATSVRVVPSLINDLVLMLADLMENATTFSPPATRVLVTAVAIGETARLTIVDHGLGMSAERLAEENARLTRRERLDLAPTEVLGLFVVGRLARRHGLGVVLVPTNGGGVTVTIDVPAHLLTTFGPMTSQPPSRPSQQPPPPDRSRPILMLANADPAMFNVGALNRATRTLHSVQPWNAFLAPHNGLAELESTPQPAIEAPLPPPRLVPNGYEQRPARTHEAEPVSLPTMPARPAPVESILRQRVPGAQLPATPRTTARSAPAPAPVRDPGQARDLVQAFESGVARAESQTQRQAPTPSRPAAPLNRRVPGATLSSLEAQARPVRSGPIQAHVTQPPDAEQARDSLADFESGVARALREVDRLNEGSTSERRVYEARVYEDRRTGEGRTGEEGTR